VDEICIPLQRYGITVDARRNMLRYQYIYIKTYIHIEKKYYI
jgi:hypothetical protein